MLNTHNLDIILQLKYMPIVMNPAKIASSDCKILEMLWSLIHLIFKKSSETPDFFNVFNLILSFSTYSQSFKKICTWELLGANVLKQKFSRTCEPNFLLFLVSSCQSVSVPFYGTSHHTTDIQ